MGNHHDARAFKDLAEFLDHLRRNKNDLMEGIQETGKLEDSTISALEAEIKSFRETFAPSNKDEVPVGSAEESGEDAQDSEQVQIVKQKR